jgi:RHS repeat-associated protein
MRIASASLTRWARLAPRRRRVTREETKGSSGQWVLASETRSVYDGMRVIQERNINGVPTVAYTRGPDLSGTLEGAGGIGGLLARSEWDGSAWSRHAFYHSDGVGNVTALAVPNGNDIALAGSYRYDPFGRLIGTPTGLAAINTQRYSSKDWHNPSGFYYFGYRFYDPATQRWLNRDPIGEEGGVNLYGYVGNNPLTYWDAFGNDPQSNMSLLKDELGGDSYDGTVCDRFTQFASDVLNETPIGQAKIALTGKNLQDEQVSLLEQISTAAGPVLGMCKKICGMAKAAKTADKFSRAPKSLMDEMVLDAAKQGKGTKIIDNLGDPKFKDMEKWSYTEKSAAGLRSEVHYVRDPKTGQLMDFKFKHHAETYK